ncbi:MAG TPA: class A beta-lactamase [Allosphingosinicella sp.]|jgi:beta-lactamase class A|uniref:class A beta-lactamase n=1 Tax=Allosphingosinicella sp. TaxID=2823234 RepID=UPI002F28B780
MRFSQWVRTPGGRRVSASLAILLAAGVSQIDAGTGTAAQPARPAAQKVTQVSPALRDKVRSVLGEVAAAPATPAMLAAQSALNARISAIGRGFNGDVGIAIKDIQTGWTAHHDGYSHYPQQSVSKFWVALAALQKADRGQINFFAPVAVTASDMTVFHQPIRAAMKNGVFNTTLDGLLHRALQQSDNTANDIILRRAGGPDAVRKFLAENGIQGIRFGPGEKLLQAGIAGVRWQDSFSIGRAFYAARDAIPQSVRSAAFARYVADPIDGATPLGLVDGLAKLKKGQLLSPASTSRMLSIMSNTQTGKQRLRGGLAPGYSLAHKTGTGQVLGGAQAGYNDIGIVTGPDGRSYAVAVMIKYTKAPLPARMQMMQNVTRAVIDYDRASGRGGNWASAGAGTGSGSK